MSPIGELLVRQPGRGDDVAEERRAGRRLSCGLVLHRPLDRHVDLAAVALLDVVLRRHALVQRDHEHVERHADRDDESCPLSVRFTKQNARIEHVGQQQDREPDVVDPVLREVDELERDLDRPARANSSHSMRKLDADPDG